MTQPATGRRERKKAATRQAIADAALRLFLDRGYDQVTIKEVADAADVSTTTLFKHFPGKEALVFDQDAEVEEKLVASVRDRAPGQGIVDALRAHAMNAWLTRAAHPQMTEFTDLIDSTPALRHYAERMWARHATALGAAIAAEVGAEKDNFACLALARFALEIPSLTRGRDDPEAAIETIFEILTHGWTPPTKPA